MNEKELREAIRILNDVDIGDELNEYLEVVVRFSQSVLDGKLVERDIDQNIMCKTCDRVGPMGREELQNLFSDLADKYFPKGECKERGALLVFIAEAIIALEGKLPAKMTKPEFVLVTLSKEKLEGIIAESSLCHTSMSNRGECENEIRDLASAIWKEMNE